MSLITLRKTRSTTKKIAEKSLCGITDELIHEEVIDFAVDLYGKLTAISENYSMDAVVDLIPELTIILNRLDASLKVNNDLKENLTDALKEVEYLKKNLNTEKHFTKETLEASLIMEEEANQEILTLKNKIKLLEESQEVLLNEIDSKNTTVQLLSADCADLSNRLDKLRADLRSNKNNENNTFKFPKTFSKSGNHGFQHQLQTFNRYEPLSPNNDSICEPPTVITVKALVHKEQTASPPPLRKPQRTYMASRGKQTLTVLADSHGKNLYPHLSGLFEEFNVSIFSKPGARLKNVVQHYPRLDDLSSKEDFILVLAGTNDIGVRQPGAFTVVQGIKKLLSWNVPINVIVADIPYRYDTPNLNNDIFYANLLIKKLIRDYKGPLKAIHLPTNEGVTRKHYTRHGLHFNRRGKLFLGRKITRIINQSKLSDNNALHNVYSSSPSAISGSHADTTSVKDLKKASSISIHIPSSGFMKGVEGSPRMLSPMVQSSLQTCTKESKIGEDDIEYSFRLPWDESPPLPTSPQASNTICMNTSVTSPYESYAEAVRGTPAQSQHSIRNGQSPYQASSELLLTELKTNNIQHLQELPTSNRRKNLSIVDLIEIG